MADDKKSGGATLVGPWLAGFLVLLSVFAFYSMQVYFSPSTAPVENPNFSQPTSPVGLSEFASDEGSSFLDIVEKIWNTLVPISVFFSLIFGSIIIYCKARIHQIRARESEIYEAVVHPIGKSEPSKAQLRWARIVEQSHSENEQDWKLAILDADIMLDELLDVQGYHGETMGDKMKQIERSDFNTIDLAWEAHKVRNRIAHEGSSHLLNAREARRVISLYEQVFKEFKYIS